MWGETLPSNPGLTPFTRSGFTLYCPGEMVLSELEPSIKQEVAMKQIIKRRENRPLSNDSNPPESGAALLRELVAHLRQNRTQLREEWARRITGAQLLTAMTEEEIFAEATSVYDNYVEALETGTFEALQAYARNLSERIIPRGVEPHEVVGIVLLLRDVLARSLFAKYHEDF